MARQFDVTREFNSTIITATITSADFATMTFVTDDVSVEVSGNLTMEKAMAVLEKQFKGSKIEHVNLQFIRGMLGWKLADIMPLAVDLNPISRQPWQDGITEEQKLMVYAQYEQNKQNKKDGK